MNKYKRSINGHDVDVYDVLKGFNVECQAVGHAIKKLLAAGQRGHKTTLEDKQEAIKSIERSIQMDESAQYLSSIEPEPLVDEEVIEMFDDFISRERPNGASYSRASDFDLAGVSPEDFIRHGMRLSDFQRGGMYWMSVQNEWRAKLNKFGAQ